MLPRGCNTHRSRAPPWLQPYVLQADLAPPTLQPSVVQADHAPPSAASPDDLPVRMWSSGKYALFNLTDDVQREPESKLFNPNPNPNPTPTPAPNALAVCLRGLEPSASSPKRRTCYSHV